MEKIKICLIGPRKSGKTALVEKFIHDRLSDEYVPTVGVTTNTVSISPIEYEDVPISDESRKGKEVETDGDESPRKRATYKSKKREILEKFDDKDIELKFFDTSSTSRNAKYLFASVRKANIVLIVLALDDDRIVQKLHNFKKLVNKENKMFIVVGTKYDIASSKQIERFQLLCKTKSVHGIMVSSKTGAGFGELFDEAILDKYASIYKITFGEKLSALRKEINDKANELELYAQRLFREKKCDEQHLKACIAVAQNTRRLNKNYFDGHIDYPTYKTRFKQFYDQQKPFIKEKKETKQKVLDILQTVTFLGLLLGAAGLITKGKFMFFKMKEDTKDKISKIDETIDVAERHFQALEKILADESLASRESSSSDVVDDVTSDADDNINEDKGCGVGKY